MSNEIDTKTLKALQQGSHKAFEEVFHRSALHDTQQFLSLITVRRKLLYMATLSRVRMPRSLRKIYL